MSNLKIAVIGAGGVGGYLGAKLTQHDYDVTIITRGKHYDAILENGLKVLEYKKESFTTHPYVVQNAHYQIYDVVFVTTKSYDFESASQTIQNCVDENTLIIPLSNGVEHSNTLKQYFPNSIVCDGTIYIISNIKEYGVIEKKSFTFYLLFGSQEENINLKVLEQLLNNCGLRTKYSHDIKYDCWKKFLFLSAMATLTTYFKKPMGYILKEQLELMIDVLLEIKKVANKKDIDITSSDIEKAVNQATHVPYDSKTSMQLDFEKGKNNELESHTGYIVKEALKLDIQVPTMEKIYNELKQR